MRAVIALLLVGLCFGVGSESKAEETAAQRSARIARLKTQFADPKVGTFIRFHDGSLAAVMDRDEGKVLICATSIADRRCGHHPVPVPDAFFSRAVEIIPPGSPGYQAAALQAQSGM